MTPEELSLIKDKVINSTIYFPNSYQFEMWAKSLQGFYCLFAEIERLQAENERLRIENTQMKEFMAPLINIYNADDPTPPLD